jgi:rubredoxin
LDGQDVFGCCENCGIVYALKDRSKVAWAGARQGRFEEGANSEPEGPNTLREVSVVDPGTPVRSQGSYWRCPDCDMEIRSDNDSDLEFAKREHIREYHPNRTSG